MTITARLPRLRFKDKEVDFMRKSRKKFFIPVLVIVLLAVSACGFLVYWDNHGIITKVDSIEEVAEYGATDFFPTDYQNYKNVHFVKNNRRQLIFESESVTMKITDPEKFESLKADIARKYGETDFFGNEPFEYKSKVFRAVTDGQLGYPKQMGFIGISESEKTIYYLWFYDFDLDSIGDMETFVVENFKQTI